MQAVAPPVAPTSAPTDPQTGLVAPGVMAPTLDEIDVEFDTLPQKGEEKLQAPVGSSKKRDLVIQYAREKLGMWYVWGGESDAEGGYDCSGLLYYAFRKAGIDIPRVSMAQADRGRRVPLNKLRPGDLVAWENNPAQRGADHIALYIGNGMILEAPKTGLKIRIRKLGASEGAWGVALDY
ncbi:C40 family peptidase [Streptosporangium sp. NPDC020072]|uniref:C40 family peptidase n=1 Tax=Streptosporangium sp. NPDC020072 TaxID=3154788 RepID=UPI0034260A29